MAAVFSIAWHWCSAFSLRGAELSRPRPPSFLCWFLFCLLRAVRAIRRGEVITHRRWMIRAFAIGVAVGTIRIWIGIFIATGLLDFHNSFAAAFWIAFILHALAAEWWVRTTPPKTG